MAFNERGEWYLPDPIENYINQVLRAIQEPGSAVHLWTDTYRRQLHNEAAKFWLEHEGLPLTPENLDFARQKIEDNIKDEHHLAIAEAHEKVPLPAQMVSHIPLYKRVGD